MSDAHMAVRQFIDDLCDGTGPLADDEDLFDALGLDGDDASGFIDAFIARFDIDATTYRWYFHHADEGANPGGLFYTPIHRRFGRIPITVAVLTEAVRTRRWPIAYPEHHAPRYRWDLLINQVLGVVVLIALAVGAWAHFTR